MLDVLATRGCDIGSWRHERAGGGRTAWRLVEKVAAVVGGAGGRTLDVVIVGGLQGGGRQWGACGVVVFDEEISCVASRCRGIGVGIWMGRGAGYVGTSVERTMADGLGCFARSVMSWHTGAEVCGGTRSCSCR